MRLPKNEIIDLGEYKITINYDGKGGLDVTVLDELNEEIEGIYIRDCPECDNHEDIDGSDNGEIDINPN